MPRYRVHVVDASDNSNIETREIEVFDDADPRKIAEKVLAEGEAIDAVVELAEALTPEEALRQLTELRAELEKLRAAKGPGPA